MGVSGAMEGCEAEHRGDQEQVGLDGLGVGSAEQGWFEAAEGDLQTLDELASAGAESRGVGPAHEAEDDACCDGHHHEEAEIEVPSGECNDGFVSG